MRLVELEKIVKKMNEDNPSDPELFNNLQKLILGFIQWRKSVPNYEDAQNIALILAEDMYIKMANDGVKFYAPLEYIRILLPSAINYYRATTNTQIINVENDPKLEESIRLLGTASAQSISDDYYRASDKVYLSQLGSVIDGMMRKSRYSKNTSVYHNLKLSVIISIKTGKEYHYHLNETDAEYVKILIVRLQDIIKRQLSSPRHDFECIME